MKSTGTLTLEEKVTNLIEAPRHPLKILALNSGKAFAEKICNHLSTNIKNKSSSPFLLTETEEVTFANGESKFLVKESIRGSDVYIVQLIDDPLSPKTTNDNLIALACAINAAYYSDAYNVTAVIPQFPYARQDKRKGREPISARIVGDLLQCSGATRAITLDIHSEAIEGFFSKLKIENLHMGRSIIKYVKENLPLEKLMIVAPDVNSAKRGEFFAKQLKTDLAIVHKSRNYDTPSSIAEMRLVGSVKGRDVLICDDMLATGGTLLNACRLLKKQGAEQIFASIALPFFSKEAHEKFHKAYTEEQLFSKIIGSNAVYWGKKLKVYPWYDELDATQLFADVIAHLNKNDSVSQLLE